MDQSKSNNVQGEQKALEKALPRHRFTIEFLVGIFTLLGVAAVGWLAVGLGGIEIVSSNKYDVFAQFDNISGLKVGASVEIAGVPVGEVTGIKLEDPHAVVTLHMDNNVKLRDDDIISIRTKGIIGDRYVKISRGASDTYIAPGGKAMETESVVDIEDIIGKIVHNFTGEKSKEEEK